MNRFDRQDGTTLPPHVKCDAGNALFALFGAIVLVGLLTAGVNNYIRGPLQTAIKQSKNSMAKAQMSVAGQVTVMGSATGAAAESYARVFKTSTNYNGNLGGLSGADSICQARATASSIPGTYKAWLSDTTGSPSTRFNKLNEPYRLLNGTLVANDWADLTDGTLAAPINVNDTGATVTGAAYTNTFANGTVRGTGDCSSWTNSTAGNGGLGQTTNTNSQWSDNGNNPCSTNTRQLYCFQQEATVVSTAGGDCDSDGTVEPLEFKAAGTTPAPVGGGLLPNSVGINKIDPWGTEYGYCVWDYGSVQLNSTCQSTSGTNRRLAGHITAQDTPVVAIISAGPDKTFSTTCRSYATADANSNGVLTDSSDLALVGKANPNDDDLIMAYTYTQASAATGGLWTLKSSNAGMATIAKKIESQAATFSGAALFGKIGTSVGDFVDVLSGLRLPNPGVATSCNIGMKYSIRRNTSSNGVEMCDGMGGWYPVSGGSSSSETDLAEVKVFVSSTTQNGNLGGLDGADAKCQTLADAAGLTGTYKAWLSDDRTYPALSLPQFSIPYKLINGTSIAVDWTDLTNGGLITSPDLDETGAVPATANNVWTNTNFDGTQTSAVATCGGWRSSSSGITASVGLKNQSGATWSNNTNTACNNNPRLYCFQQSSAKPIASYAPTQANVFVTSTTYSGDLGGLAGADAKCQTQANAAGLTGNYRAWLADQYNTPSTRLYRASGGYKLVNGTVVASSWADLTDGTLTNGISLDETGVAPVVTNNVWTNVTTAGARSHAVNHCSGWTSATGAAKAGTRGATSSNWTGGTDPTCAGPARLYCFQQTTGGTSGGTLDGLTDVATNSTLGNLFAGTGVGNATTLGTNNTAIGMSSMQALTSGANNTAFGYMSLTALTTGNENTAFGSESLKLITTGLGNTAFGDQTGKTLAATTNYTTMVGYQAGGASGNNSTLVGSEAGNQGEGVVAFGANALDVNTGSNNTAVGNEALKSNTTGTYNTAVGRGALLLNVTGNDNTALGNYALYWNTASENTAAGYYALENNTTGVRNLAIGADASRYATGDDNTSIGYYALRGAVGQSTGSNNTATGAYSLTANTSGSRNTAVGWSTLAQNATGNDNIGLGYYALAAAANQNFNVAAGSYALNALKTGVNTALGSQALKALISGTGNTAAGYNAGVALTSSSANVIIGSEAMTLNNTNDGQVAIGYKSMTSATGGFNTAMGYESMSKITGSYNTALGYWAYKNPTNANFNTVAGYNAGYNGAGTNTGNTLVGANANQSNNNLYNTMVGSSSGKFIGSNSNYNTSVGFNSMLGVGTAGLGAVGNTAIGHEALYGNGEISGNTAAGYRALASNEGDFNSGGGAYALEKNVDGAFNTALGYNALRQNISGTGNTAVGTDALRDLNGTGFVAANCTGLGDARASDSVTGHCYWRQSAGAGVAAIGGRNSCSNAKAGSYPAIITSAREQAIVASVNGGGASWIGLEDRAKSGEFSWFGNGDEKSVPVTRDGQSIYGQYTNWNGGSVPANGTCIYLVSTTNKWAGQACGTSGLFFLCEAEPVSIESSYNTAIGTRALANATTGSYNTAIGFEALRSTTTGNDNTAFGYQAGEANITGSKNIFLGAYSDAGSGNLNNAIAIGYQASVTASNAVRVGNGSVTTIEGQVAFTATSDMRVKKDIAPTDLGLDFVMGLKPVSYRLKQGNGRIDYGFLAQDIDGLLDGRVTNMIIRRNDEIRTMELRASDLLAPLVKAMQDQQVIIDRLEKKIAAIKKARRDKACSASAPTGGVHDTPT